MRLSLVLLAASAVCACVDAPAPVFDNPYDPMGSGDLPVQVMLTPKGAGAQIDWSGGSAVVPAPTGWVVDGAACNESSANPVETSGALSATATSWTSPGPVPRGGCRDYRVRAIRDDKSRPSAPARLQRPGCSGGPVNNCGGCDLLCADEARICSGTACGPCTTAAQCGAGRTCDTNVSPAACAKPCAKDADCGAGSYCAGSSVCNACGLADAAHCGTASSAAGCSQCSGARAVCAAGACGCPNTVCGQTCVDVSSDPKNCGQCGKVCPASAPGCKNDVCVVPNYFWALWPIAPDGPTNYTDNKDGTVKDNLTGLVWQQGNSPTAFYWQAAKDYCAALPLSGGGWRFPTRMELVSLVDFTGFSPSINATFFPAAAPTAYLSSSPYVGEISHHWIVDFTAGFTQDNALNEVHYVRCVR